MTVDERRMFASDHAEAAAEAIRQLNRATLFGGYEWPADVSVVINRLVTLVERLPQALDQASTWLEGQHRSGRVGHDCGNDRTAETVHDAVAELRQAARLASDLAWVLGSAQDAAFHLTGIEGPEELALRSPEDAGDPVGVGTWLPLDVDQEPAQVPGGEAE